MKKKKPKQWHNSKPLLFIFSRFSEVQKHLLSVTEKKAREEINKSCTYRHVQCIGNMNPCLKKYRG